MDQVIIKTEYLTKLYGMGDARVSALDHINLQIKKNEFVAIMGPSGSGKSTLLNILGCLDQPTSGDYFLNGINVSGLNKTELAIIRNQKIGFVFQSYNLLPNTTALENVMLPLLYKRNDNKTSTAEQRMKALQLLEAVGLANRVYHKPSELSGGQLQRVAIARALVNNPVMILADEPTGNLDSKSGKDIMNLLLDLHDKGRTIVMVTHDNDVSAAAQRVIHLQDGHIVKDLFNGNSQESSAEKEIRHAGE